jgi:phenylacetate-coenzyme A ligase PaaK-like adenylate-forming protein
MSLHPTPPFNPWLWWQACLDTWLATQDPQGAGQRFPQQRLARLIECATRESPLYARRAHGARALADFAPIGKAELMEHFDEACTDRSITRAGAKAFAAQPDGVADTWLGRYLLWTSSGTSGQPGLFVQDAASLAAFDAIDALRLRAQPMASASLGLWGLGRRFAYVGAIGGHYAGHVSLTRLRRIVPAPWAPRLDVISVLEPLSQVAERLQRLQPDVLITYPSAAVALARLQEQGHLSLKLTELWLGGEQCSASQREFLRATLGCETRNSYGASEFYSMAFECAQGHLHLNSDWVLLEPVDAQGRPAAPGEFSHHTWLTNLANLTQPLIRYELHDRLRFVAAPCPCGNPLPVIEVQGRSDDALSLPGRNGRPVTVLPLALESVIEEGCGITEFQLLHHTDGALELRLPSRGSTDLAAAARCREVLLAWLAEQGAKPPRLLLSHAAPQCQTGSGKLRRVIDLHAGR